jgi:Domain of unknown function (DUF4412)
MKLAGLSLLLSAALLLSARADLTIVQKVEGIGPVSELTMKIKGDKARVDVSPKMTAIIDGKTGEMINLMHEQKMVIRMSAEKMKAAMEMARQFSGKDEKKETGEKPKFVPSGKKEVVNGYDTEEYIYETPQFKASYWIASKYPDGAAILKQLQSVNPAVWKTSNTHMPDYRDFPGLPIKTVISSGGNQITTTLASVKQDPLSDADFAVPKDYQEMKLPDMSGLLGASPKP